MVERHYYMVGEESPRQKREREERERREREEQEAWRKDMKRHPWKLFGYTGIWMCYFVFFFVTAVVLGILDVKMPWFYLLLLTVPIVPAVVISLWAFYTDRMNKREDDDHYTGGSSSGVEWGRLSKWFMRGQLRRQMRKASRW